MKRALIWGGFALVVVLIIWGLIAAERKADFAGVVRLPDEVTAEDWIAGSSTSAHTLVEYSDFQCPACGSYHPVLKQLLAEHGDEFRFVYRHFPLPQHRNAYPAAIAAEAAGKQGKFWEMHHILFERQEAWETMGAASTTALFVTYAEEIGLDIERFRTDVADGDKVLENKVTGDMVGGTRSGINSTPTFFLDGVKITNPAGYEAFVKIITSKVE